VHGGSYAITHACAGVHAQSVHRFIEGQAVHRCGILAIVSKTACVQTTHASAAFKLTA
jgi:hypothetical protein